MASRLHNRKKKETENRSSNQQQPPQPPWLSSSGKAMTHLAPSTIETISKTLSLYNTLPLAKIYIFYNKKPRLQYVGSYAVSSHDGDDNDNTEEEVERVEAMVRELDLRHGEKLIDFSFDGDSYVGHLKGDFVFVYFLVGSTPR